MTMFIALNENKKLIHINNTVRGLACNCTCFECGESVLARKGEIKEHHFAHINNKESCVIHPESVLHKYAKEVIIESMGLRLPQIPSLEIESKWWAFDEIIPEFNLGEIRPDLIGYINNEPIFIEIAVTHFIDANKLKIIKSLNIKTLEIDLSDFLNTEIRLPSDQAKCFILESLSNKRWILPVEIIKPVITSPITSEIYLSTVSNREISIHPKAPVSWENYSFTINGIWVHARKFSSGMLSVNCAAYNPKIIVMLRQWRNEGGGRYNPKYKSWNYWQPFSETVLKRLQEIHSNQLALPRIVS